MTLVEDLIFCLKPRCPACRQGRLFKPHSVDVVNECDVCHANLGQYTVGDGASVFLIFLLGATIIPTAWLFECLVHPPLWVHAALWGCVALGLIVVILPTVKAYIILLEHKHQTKA